MEQCFEKPSIQIEEIINKILEKNSYGQLGWMVGLSAVWTIIVMKTDHFPAIITFVGCGSLAHNNRLCPKDRNLCTLDIYEYGIMFAL